MKKLNLGNINAGLNSLKAATDNAAQNGRFELIDTALIDFAAKNSYAADDNEESYKELAANIDEVGLLTPLGVIVNGNRYTLFSGERRFRAITTYLHWTKVPCYVFETKSVRKAQLMLHQANASREYTPQRKLQLYEEYRELLEEMKEAGEIKGGIPQKQLAHNYQTASATVDGNDVTMLDDEMDTDSTNAIAPLTVVNTRVFITPMTGDRGTQALAIGGVLVFCLGTSAFIFFLVFKRRKEQEDK